MLDTKQAINLLGLTVLVLQMLNKRTELPLHRMILRMFFPVCPKQNKTKQN